MHVFHGVIPYLVSPIDEKGNVKRDVLTDLCNDLFDSGVHGFAPLGSTGEFAYLSREQKRDVVGTVVKAAAKRIPVIAGVASTTICEAVSMAKEWERLGCDAILATLESYFPLNEDEVYSYFAAVSESVSLPVILYTNPSFQKTDISIAVLKKLAQIENIRGIKDASSNTGRLLSIKNTCGGTLEIFAASAHISTCVMMIGGKGFMSGPACIAPKQSVRLYECCKKGQWEEAMRIQDILWQLNQAFNSRNLAACIKAGLEMRGYDVGYPLPPQSPLSDKGREELRAVLAKVDAL